MLETQVRLGHYEVIKAEDAMTQHDMQDYLFDLRGYLISESDSKLYE